VGLSSIPARYQTPAAALCALLLGAAWLTTWGWRHQATNALVEQEFQRSIAVATSLSNALLPRYRNELRQAAAADGQASNGKLRNALDAELATLLRGQRVAQVTIYDARGVAVYASPAADLKSQPSQDADVRRALRGDGNAQLSHIDGTTGERDFVRAFVPANPGEAKQQDAVFELQSEVTGAMKAIREDAQGMFANANLVGLTLFAVALMILRRAEEEQRRKDSVTGLPGREIALAALSEVVAGFAVEPGPRRIGWLLVGLQRLPQVSAAYGHKAAEDVQREAAKRLRVLPDAEGRLYRLGGEAFALPIVDGAEQLTDEELAARLAYQVQVCFDKPFDCAGHAVLADLAIGIALGSTGAVPEDLMNRAEVALTEARRRGNSQWVLYVPGLEQGVRERLEAIGELREAWEKRQFQVYYQPLVDSGNRRWVGCEALVRWAHPERGIVHPETFVPLLEETGLIVEVGLFVMREACRQMAAWRQSLDGRLVVSVNLSARQFADPNLLEDVRSVLAETTLPADALIVEVTETFLAMDPDYASKVLTELRALGVAVAIDDFGVGYSSLSSLRHLPVDILKIDRSFVSQAPTDPIDASIAEAIAALARGLHLTLVAEGVETEAQADFTRNIGCQKHQGYLFARPLDAATFETSYPKT